MEEKAYAKINLGLEVVKKRDDGYHDLRMFNVSINLFDTLTFNESDDIIVEMDNLPTDSNLIYQTVLYMKNLFHVNKGVKIKVDKKIRMGAGLAGGSSDAAATIRGLNRLWELGLDIPKMREIAIRIGSDVPFCITGRSAFVYGRGEIIDEFDFMTDYDFVLVFPDYQSFTKEVFENCQIFKDNKFAKLEENIDNFEKYVFNDLETAVDNKSISDGKILIRDIKKYLINNGCINAVMSGSGSTVIGITKNKDEVIKKMTKRYPHFNYLAVKVI